MDADRRRWKYRSLMNLRNGRRIKRVLVCEFLERSSAPSGKGISDDVHQSFLGLHFLFQVQM